MLCYYLFFHMLTTFVENIDIDKSADFALSVTPLTFKSLLQQHHYNLSLNEPYYDSLIRWGEQQIY